MGLLPGRSDYVNSICLGCKHDGPIQKIGEVMIGLQEDIVRRCFDDIISGYQFIMDEQKNE